MKKIIIVILLVLLTLAVAIIEVGKQDDYAYYHIDSNKQAEIVVEDEFFDITPEEGIALVNAHAAEYGVDKLPEKAHIFVDSEGQEEPCYNIIYEYSNANDNIRLRFTGAEDNNGKIDVIEVIGLPGEEKTEEFDRQLCGYYTLLANLVNPEFNVEKFLKRSRWESREQDAVIFNINENIQSFEDGDYAVVNVEGESEIICTYLILARKDIILDRYVEPDNKGLWTYQ